MDEPTIGPAKINGQTYRRPVIEVAVVTLDGSSCTVPVGELMDMIGDGEEYIVRIKTMRVAEFERMPEFDGF